MFDIGWTEILVIATIAVVVVGPKELPRMLRTFGATMGQLRRTANEFRRQFDDALREAEREAGLEDTRKELQSIVKADPLKSVKKDISDTMQAAQKSLDKTTTEASDKPKLAEPPSGEASPEAPHEAEPVKTGAAAEPARGSGAA